MPAFRKLSSRRRWDSVSKLKTRGLEDLGVGLERDLGAAAVGDAGVLELGPAGAPRS